MKGKEFLYTYNNANIKGVILEEPIGDLVYVELEGHKTHLNLAYVKIIESKNTEE
jgi:hypothetical protein